MTTTNSKLKLVSRPNWLVDRWQHLTQSLVPLDVWRSSVKPGKLVDFIDAEMRALSGVVIEIHSCHHGATMVDVLTKGRPVEHRVPMRHIFPEGFNQAAGYYSEHPAED